MTDVRREQLPANEQRPPGNPEEQKEGPRAVVAFDGEFVQGRDAATMSEDVKVSEDEVFVCPECEREFKTTRGLDSHFEAKHSEDEAEDESDDEDEA